MPKSKGNKTKGPSRANRCTPAAKAAAKSKEGATGIESPLALTLAGSDPSAGAGLQSDLRMFQQLGVYGMAIPTALTVQNSCGVQMVYPVEVDSVWRSLEALWEDMPPSAAKLGLAGAGTVLRQIRLFWEERPVPLVCDPVLSSTSGWRVADEELIFELRELLPVITLLTPNVPEAMELTGCSISNRNGMEEAANRLCSMGAQAVLLKGGHLGGPTSADLLFLEGEDPCWFEGERLSVGEVHGTGCALSSSICALLARGKPLKEAVLLAVHFLREALQEGLFWPGKGAGFLGRPAWVPSFPSVA